MQIVQMQKLSTLLALTACTNLSTQESVPDYSVSQSEAAKHHSHFCIRCIVYSAVGPLSSTPVICGSSSYFTETSWLALHKEKAGNNLMPQPCA